MNEFSFTNKVACHVVSKRSGWQKFLLGCGICSLLLTLLLFSMEGFQGINFVTGLFLPAFLLHQGLRKKHTSIYTYTDANVQVSDSSIQIQYPHICRDEEQGIAEEKYIYRTDDLIEYQYSKSLSAVRLWGTPIAEINGKHSSRIDYRESLMKKEVVLYMEENLLHEFTSSIKEKMNLMPEILE